MKIAAAAYPLSWLDDWEAYEEKISDWVAGAADEGADLLIFPEYAAMELATLAGPEIAAHPEHSIVAVSEFLPEADALHMRLAAQHGVHICAGSAPFRQPSGRPVNRARLIAPSGLIGWQDKLIMTRFEREEWDIAPGDAAIVFETDLGRIGILTCYDAEFPLNARAMVEAGAEVLLVPSCTEALSGYWRVRIGAMARALESQCVVAHAPLVGSNEWSEAVDTNTGAAAIYGPPDLGFPDTGVIAEGPMNTPCWVIEEVDLAAVRKVRKEGRVLNMVHWREQDDRLEAVQIIGLETDDQDGDARASSLG
ncbi:MAG: carbon-nitrogen hydrolase family protein [Pseudomonadota bacterium]